MANKVFIYGLDGATFKIIDPLIKDGHLPNIKRMIDNGARGVLRSTFPPVSGPAWTSFLTGKNPEKHGIFDFVKIDDQGERTPTTSLDNKSRTIFDILTHYDKRTIAINVPMTYPPKKLNGILVSGYPTPKGANYTYPEEFKVYLENKKYLIDFFHINSSDTMKCIQATLEAEKKRGEIVSDLARDEEWDVFICVFTGTDSICHLAWENKEFIHKMYKSIDVSIGRINRQLGKDVHKIIISDHGFVTMDYDLFLNRWLELNGYLCYEKKMKFGSKKPIRTTIKKLLKLLKLNPQKIKAFLPNRARRFMRGKGIERNFPINWEKTSAYVGSANFWGINVNLKGREKNGIIERHSSSHETIKNEISNALRKLVNPDTGELIFDKVISSEEFYQGPFVKDVPDIVLVPNGNYFNERNTQGNDFVSKLSGEKGFHDMEGILIAEGESIASGQTVSGATLVDLAPTILHITDTPIPDDIDGGILEGMFRKGSVLANRESKSVKSLEIDASNSTQSVTKDAEEEIKEKLKGLGYM